MSITFGTNKASDRKALKDILVAVGLTTFVASVVGTAEKKNTDLTNAVSKMGFVSFAESTMDVLRTQVSGSRGRPALEEQPIHTIIVGLREAIRTFQTSKEDVAQDKANKVLGKALKKAQSEEANLVARRATFKPSKRVQGTKLLAILPTAEEA